MTTEPRDALRSDGKALCCPECGWLYGRNPIVPSHTCPGAGAWGITQRERVEGK